MSIDTPISPYFKKSRPKGVLISNSILLLISFSTVFFPRLLDSAGAPAPINFLHFLVVPLVTAWNLARCSQKNRKQRLILNQLLALTYLFSGVVLASSFLNDAALVNAALSFLLLAEPAIFLVSLLSVNYSTEKFLFLRTWLIRFSAFHVLLSLAQAFLLDLGIMKTGAMGIIQDNIQGVFYLSGGGHNAAASVSVNFGLYYLISAPKFPGVESPPHYLRYAFFLGAFFQLLKADSKQTLLVMLAAWVLLTLLTKVKEIGTFIKYSALITLLVFALFWAIDNVPLFRAFGTWLRPDIWGPDGIATQLKIAAFPVITSHYESFLNWFLGLGPGHTVGRLGGWLLPKYSSLLGPLGATVHPASQDVWGKVAEAWLGNNSSMFSPLFGWAGVWGDLGFLGLGVYAAMGYAIWKNLCLDDFSRFILLSIVVHGFIFTQMEEPGFMIHSAVLIFLRWKELEFSKIELGELKDEPKKRKLKGLPVPVRSHE